MTSARSESGEHLLEHHDLATVSKTGDDDVKRLVQDHFLARAQLAQLDVRETFTRILRPPVNTSHVSSSLAFRKTPKPDGGCASRSTSSFSATIWSRASRSVVASRSF